MRGRFSRTTGESEPGYDRVRGNLVLIIANCQGQSRKWLVSGLISEVRMPLEARFVVCLPLGGCVQGDSTVHPVFEPE